MLSISDAKPSRCTSSKSRPRAIVEPGCIVGGETGEYSSPKRTLLVRGLRPRARFGQTFLVDAKFAQRIAAALPPDAFVIEIGGGTGTLTEALAERARRLEVLEIDRGLCDLLRERFADAARRVTIVEGDALDVDFAARLSHEQPPRAICGNLPYNITTPLLERITASADHWESAVIMVQREYAKRLTAHPGTPDYSSLTLFAQHFCTAERLFEIGAAGFYPAPRVSSTVVRLTPRRGRRSGAADALLLWLVRAAFSQRRKLLVNAVTSAMRDSASRLLVVDAMERAGIAQSARAERLEYDDFERLANALHEAGLGYPLSAP